MSTVLWIALILVGRDLQKIIWKDENFFSLHQKPHRKNDGFWSESNPHKMTETNDRNDVKVMIWRDSACVPMGAISSTYFREIRYVIILVEKSAGIIIVQC